MITRYGFGVMRVGAVSGGRRRVVRGADVDRVTRGRPPRAIRGGQTESALKGERWSLT